MHMLVISVFISYRPKGVSVFAEDQVAVLDEKLNPSQLQEVISSLLALLYKEVGVHLNNLNSGPGRSSLLKFVIHCSCVCKRK